jgi:hypothetical protein
MSFDYTIHKCIPGEPLIQNIYNITLRRFESPAGKPGHPY